MSVAFRREGDDEHLEPKFELPIPPGPNLVTPRGLALIQAKVAMLEAAVADETEEEARKKLRRDLRYWGTRQATAILAPPPADTVAFGSQVSFRLNGKTRMISIVGDDEAEPAIDYIAWSAPLARAMMGLGEGDYADFNGVEDAVEILSLAAVD